MLVDMIHKSLKLQFSILNLYILIDIGYKKQKHNDFTIKIRI